MDVPISTSENQTFSPPSLGNLEPRPSFRFRPPSPRSRRRYTHDLTSEGLRYHSTEAIQAETVRALRGLWAGDEDQLRATEARMNSFWETVRQAAKDPTVRIEETEANEIAAALTRLTDNWPMLRQMNADNSLFNSDAPKIALGRFLCGWSGLETRFKLQDGSVPIDVLDALETEIDAIEVKAMVDGVEGIIGVAFKELELHALGLMGLTADTEKNSPSPSSQSDIQNGSPAAGSEAAVPAGKSGSGSSRPAPRQPRRKKRASS